MEKLDLEKCSAFRHEIARAAGRLKITEYEMWYTCQDMANMALAEVQDDYLKVKKLLDMEGKNE